MDESSNRMLLYVAAAVLVFGGAAAWMLHVEKTRKPELGWYSLGTETFDLKPSAYRGFSYREVPAKFRVELHATAPVEFGFVTPEVYGHYTTVPTPIDFATLPCGSGQTTSVDLNCNTEASKRYLLLTDAREDSVPDAPPKKGQAQPAQPENHITVTMYEWRCLKYCGNAPSS